MFSAFKYYSLNSGRNVEKLFFVINKEKVYSYMVTLSVIGVLFTISVIYPKDAVNTSSSNVYSNNNIVENGIKN